VGLDDLVDRPLQELRVVASIPDQPTSSTVRPDLRARRSASQSIAGAG
jgi:hypothetical protein